MFNTIFCPNHHLILNENRCRECGWMRPLPGQNGELLWPPMQITDRIGGPGRSSFAVPAEAQGVVVLPLPGGRLVGLDLLSGAKRWEAGLPGEGLDTQHLVADGSRILASLSDQRSLEQARVGHLAALDPLSGTCSLLWQADSHQLSPPALTEKHIILRTSRSELLAFSRAPQPEVVWRKPLLAWWPILPAVIEGHILVSDGQAMRGEGFLTAFTEQDGRQLWKVPTDSLLAYPPDGAGGILVVSNGKRQLRALRLHTGEQVWEGHYERIYCAPLVDHNLVYLVVRGAPASQDPDHYRLVCLDLASGQEVWRLALGHRASHRLYMHASTLLLLSDEGNLLGVDIPSRSLVYNLTVGAKDDPPQSELCLSQGIAFGGTYFGQVFAARVSPAPQAPDLPPAKLLKSGEFEAAANGFALQGDYARAAEIIADRLERLLEARLLYRHARLWREAGNISLRMNEYEQALKDFENAGDLAGQAEALLKMGDELGAARKYEQAGKLETAAELYLQAGETREAFELFIRLGNTQRARTLESQIDPVFSDISRLEDEGRLGDAGEWALRLGEFARAADLFQRAEQPERELEALRALSGRKPEEWVWRRICELARSEGRFLDEAVAWRELHRLSPRFAEQAAEAFRRAALQAEARLSDTRTPLRSAVQEKELKNQLGDLFEQAAGLYEEAGMNNRWQECQEKIILHRCLPRIEVSGRAEKAFIEGEFNKITLQIRNTGCGLARNVLVAVTGKYFEVDETNQYFSKPIIGVGALFSAEVMVKPQPGQIGETVPLVLEWSWEDDQQRRQERKISTPVMVKRQSSPVGGTPIVMHGGTVIHADRYIAGDQLEGNAQKGDRVDMGGSGKPAKIISSGVDEDIEKAEKILLGRIQDLSGMRECPACHTPTAASNNFCEHCGKPLPSL